MTSWMNDEKRLSRYFNYVERVIDNLRIEESNLKARVKEIVENAKSYYEDAKYYAKLRDYSTSYVCIAYCEGLLDALKLLGLVTLKNEEGAGTMRKKVMVAGVFDILHPGHIYLISKAAELGDVVVVVARDSTVERMKGRRPIIPEEQRLEVIRNINGVKEAVLGYEGDDMLKIVEDIKPDIIMLGPDQNFDEEKLRKELKSRGLEVEVVRLKEAYTAHKLCSTSKILKEILSRRDVLCFNNN